MKTSESRRRASWLRPFVPFAAAACLLAPAAGGQQAPAADAAPATAVAEPEDLINPAAREALKRMVETLTGAQRMSYEYEYSYDALQDDGELLEFGSRGTNTIRRPDRLRGEVWFRDGRNVRYAWDGERVSIYNETRNTFASTPRSGDLDSLVDFLREDVGFKMPVADLFTSDLRTTLVDGVVAARHLGKETLDEVEVEHVAMRMRSGIDVQLWIRTGEHALPKRLVMNFATADGRPQFRSDFREWNLDPRVRDSQFELEAPKGAKVVPFALPTRRAAQAAEEEAQ